MAFAWFAVTEQQESTIFVKWCCIDTRIQFIAVFSIDSTEDKGDACRSFTIFRSSFSLHCIVTCVQTYKVLFEPSGALYVTSSPLFQFSLSPHHSVTGVTLDSCSIMQLKAAHTTDANYSTIISRSVQATPDVYVLQSAFIWKHLV